MKNIYYLLCLLFPLSVMGQEPTGKSQWVYSDANGKLVYKTTKRGDRIIDFSHAGYKGGGVTLLFVLAKLTEHFLAPYDLAIRSGKTDRTSFRRK